MCCPVKTCVPFAMNERSHIFLLCIQGSMSESYNVMKEQVEKAKEELKIQENELEKSKKEVTSFSDLILRRKKKKRNVCYMSLHVCSFCQNLTHLHTREVSDLLNQDIPL